MFSSLGVLICCFSSLFGGTVSLEFDVVFDNKTVDILDFLIPTVFSDNERCRNDSLLYRQELSKFTVWATDMFDASSKFPSGLFLGSIYDTGNFDECVNVKLPKEIGFSGQHCMAHFKFKPLENIAVDKSFIPKYNKYENIFNISTWRKIETYALDRSKQSRDESYFSFCLPSSCSYGDLDLVLKRKIEEVKDKIPFSLNVRVDPRNCQVLKDDEYSSADLIFIGVIGALSLLGLICTLYDINSRVGNIQQFSGTLHEVLKCFSFSHTCGKLITIKKNEHGLDCLNGIKVLSIMLVILGHRIMFYISSPLSNPVYVERTYTKFFPYAGTTNGPLIVDTFFVISGILGSYLLLLEFDKRQKMVRWELFCLHKFLRLTPAYAVVLAFYCTIFIRLGEGPFWEERIGVEQERCIANWWTNILYINNYFTVGQLCMFQSWFLTCNFHYLMILPILIYLIWKKPKFGITVLIFLVIVSLMVPFVIILVNKEEPILLVYMRFLRDPVLNHNFQTIYIPSHMRASSFFLGILAGYLKYKMRKTGYKLSKTVIYTCWMCFFVILSTVYISAFSFYFPNGLDNDLFNATYGSLQHLLWSYLICWIIIAVSEGGGSWIKPILTWKPFSFLDRINYTTYLCHGAVQMYSAAVARGPIHTSDYFVFSMAASDITLSYFVGFLLTLVVEGPCLSLEKIIFASKVASNTSQIENREEKQLRDEHIRNLANKNELNSKKHNILNGFTDIYIPRLQVNE